MSAAVDTKPEVSVKGESPKNEHIERVEGRFQAKVNDRMDELRHRHSNDVVNNVIRSHNAMTAVQERLNAKGFRVAVDGIYGEDTKIQIESLESTNGLRKTGLPGPKVLGALFGKLGALKVMRTALADRMAGEPFTPSSSEKAHSDYSTPESRQEWWDVRTKSSIRVIDNRGKISSPGSNAQQLRKDSDFGTEQRNEATVSLPKLGTRPKVAIGSDGSSGGQ